MSSPFLHFDRNASAYIHEPTLLNADFSDLDIVTLRAEHGLAKLVFVPLGLHDHLLQDTAMSTAHLHRLPYHVCKELLHPQGTIIVSLPVPIYKHHGRIVGELPSWLIGRKLSDVPSMFGSSATLLAVWMGLAAS